MLSPRRRGKLPMPQSRQLSEPSLPLHLALGWIIIRAFPVDHECQPIPIYSPLFTADILRVISTELLEVASLPATYLSLREELDPLVKAETSDISKRNDKKRSRGQVVAEDYAAAEEYISWMGDFAERFPDVAEGCSFLDGLEKELRKRFNYNDDEEPAEFSEPLERHSPLGVFARNLVNILRKLSFDETSYLARQVANWCGVSVDGPSREKETAMWSLDRRSAMEDTLDKRIGAMQDYQAANASGDWSLALSSLRKFYDYQFPSSGRGQHQHALLNIASFHYMAGGLESAQAAVDEAIRVARTAGDKACLQHCLSLMHHIRTERTSTAFSGPEKIRIHQRPLSSARLAESTTPMDDLWSVKAALDMGEPVHIAFRRIHTALGKESRLEADGAAGEDEKRTKQWRTGESLNMAAWHATQAGLWSMLGSNVLAEHHENLALAEMAPWDDGQLTVILSRAQRLAESAEYDRALATLLDMSTLHGITMSQYHRWSKVVWAVLERRAQMSGDEEHLSYLHSLHPSYTSRKVEVERGVGGPDRDSGHPPSRPISSHPGHDTSSTKTSHITEDRKSSFSRGIINAQSHLRALLRKSAKLLSANAPAHLILPDILAAVQLSSELGLWKLYRFGAVVLGEVMLTMNMGMGGRVKKDIEAVWDQILEDDDQEVIARAALCLAKAELEIILDDNASESETISSSEVRVHLLFSLEAADKLGSRKLAMECTQLLALLSELDRESEQHLSGGEEYGMVGKYLMYLSAGQGCDAEDKQRDTKVVEVVQMVGVRVAEGWK